MPRKIYGLSNATRDILENNVKRSAIALDVSTSFIYQVLREEKADWFPPFLDHYERLLDAGISVFEYDAELEFARDRRMRPARDIDIKATFKTLLHEQNRTTETYVDAIQDGEWTEAELNAIEDKLLVERDVIGVALNAVKIKKDEVRQTGPLRVA